MKTRARKTVTRGPWSVSVITGTGIKGAQLSACRHFDPSRDRRVSHYAILRGDGDGKLFATSELAWAWAAEHGYIQEASTPWCLHCRERHTSRQGAHERPSGFCPVLSRFVFSEAS